MKKIFQILFACVLLSLYAFSVHGNDKTPPIVSLEEIKIVQTDSGSKTVSTRVHIAQGYHIYGPELDDEYLIPTRIKTPADTERINVVYPEPKLVQLDFLGKEVPLYEDTVTFLITFSSDSQPPVLTLSFQPCTDNTCFQPQEIPIPLDNANAADSPGKTDKNGIKKEENPFSGKNLPVKMLFVLLLGLGLNLTPCVYPMIPITISFFGSQSGKNTQTIIKLSLVYVTGLSMTFAAFGMGAALTGKAFGTLLRSAITSYAVAAVFIFLAFSMFGMYEIQIPAVILSKLTRKKGYIGAFLMGSLLGFVGAPCTGPLLIALLTHVVTKASLIEGTLLFLCTGIGLGLPYVFLAVFSGSIQKIPSSGEWMEWVKKIFGTALVLTGVYFLIPVLSHTIYYLLSAAVSTVLAVYMYLSGRKKEMDGVSRIIKILLVVSCIVNSVYAGYTAFHQPQKVRWIPYSEKLLAESRNNSVVLIDFYASWCAPCRTMDEKVFTSKDILDLENNVIFIKADVTAGNDEDQAVMDTFGVQGVPALILFGKKDGQIKRINGFIDASALKRELTNFLK